MKEKRKVLMQPAPGCDGILAMKVGRNDPCPCGSGKKAKHCCGCDTKYYSRTKVNFKSKK